MPKRSRVPPVIRPGSRKPTKRWDEERRGQLMAMALGALVVIAVAAIALVGYYETKVRPKGETVLQVGSRSFNLDYLERRLRYDIQQGNTYYQSNPTQAVTFLLSEITQEELTRQGAPEKGVDISDADIDAEIRSRENVPDDADQNTFAAAYRKAVRDSGLSTQGYRDIIAASLAQNALKAQFDDQAPKTADQVRFRVIVLATEDDANTALQRLQNGEDFATVAKDLSQDSSSKDNGGEQDWTPRGVLDPALEEPLFSLPVGQISDIITGQNALFIVQVEERQDQRETTDTQRSTLGSLALQQWVSDVQGRLGVSNSLNDGQRNSILQVLQDELQKGQ